MAKSAANTKAAKARTIPGTRIPRGEQGTDHPKGPVPKPAAPHKAAPHKAAPHKAAPKAPPKAAPTTRTVTTTTQVPAPPAQPFLTPVQQAALDHWNTTYKGDLANLDQGDLDAQASHDQSLSSDTLANAKSVDQTNQAMAARGVFESSIHDGALNDLAATLTQQTNILNTTLHSALLRDQTQRETLGGQNAATQDQYSGQAVENAQALPPNTATTPVTTTTQVPVANTAPAGSPHLAPHPAPPPARVPARQPGGPPPGTPIVRSPAPPLPKLGGEKGGPVKPPKAPAQVRPQAAPKIPGGTRSTYSIARAAGARAAGN